VLLPGVAGHRGELPDQTRWVWLRGCGHVAMFDDPEATAALLLKGSDPDTAPGLGTPVR
jgi:pimeloyl-ACP methyl ester carboxylesterase